MKRAAAKQLIERYYYQLTNGCGDTNCRNAYCSSCPEFCFRQADRNSLALRAIDLFRTKVKLCDYQPNKLRRPSQDSDEFSGKNGGELKTKGDKPSTSSTIDAETYVSNIVSAFVPSVSKVTYLTEEKVYSIIDDCKAVDDWSKLIHTIGSVFNSPDSLILSFRKIVNDKNRKSPTIADSSTKDASPQSVEMDVAEKSDTESMKSDSECDVPSPVRKKLVTNITLDIEGLRRCFERLMDIPGHPFQSALINALRSLSKAVEMDIKYHNALKRDPNYINVFLIVFEIPLLHSPEFIEHAFPVFCRALGHLSLDGQALLARVLSEYPINRLREMLQALQQLVTVKVINGDGQWGQQCQLNDDDGIGGAAKVMKILYYANILGGKCNSSELVEEEKRLETLESQESHEFLQGAVSLDKELYQAKDDPLAKELSARASDCREPLIPFEEFVNEPLNDYIDISTDYAYYRAESDLKFSFVTHNFILTTASKHMTMYFDNRIRMLNERRTSFLQTIIHGAPPMPYLKLCVRRNHVIEDALISLEMFAMQNPNDLKKQLFVEFDGEQGLDEGGVSKEFFQLVVEKLFNPDIGMFTHNEESNLYWFNPTSFENDGQFTLIGIMLGLAIYNSCILDVHFPMVVYRKLMGKIGTMEDLHEFDPTLANSLQHILDYKDDDVEDVFLMNFHVSYHDVFGNNLTTDLKPNGSSIPVTASNKQEFVKLYIDFLLNKSIERQFKAFKRGFNMVTNESPLRMLFRPDEIELLVCGSKVLDFNALEEATEYDNGFTAQSTTIRNFWEIVHAFPETEKRKLLQFTTGTDRVPVGGLSKLKLTIAKNGPDSDRLPTSHTCFNVLLLPDYDSKTKLEERLLKAITYSKGFGML
ncbi:ubiquitin-protein ligase E3A [Patella vulgata]|uniref:ubiquitin-protein ligase E3A n=1 Tax=Patella vulgata TaxID=6465 RepID=UPI00217F5126|nr:ubiquitin-protein ligase E3A [Patella vulgata]